MPDDVQIPPEVLEAAARLGIKPGEWGEVKEQVGSGMAAKQRELLLRLRGAMETVVARDMKTVAELRETLARLEHGGGA